MAESKGDSHQGETHSVSQTVGRTERDRLLEEVWKILSHPKHGGQTEKFERDWIFSNCSFGLGIDPNG